MKILKLLNSKFFLVILFFFLSQGVYAEDQPVDIWNTNKDKTSPSSQQEVLETENEDILKKKSEGGVYQMQSQRNLNTIELDQTLDTKEIEIIELEPEDKKAP